MSKALKYYYLLILFFLFSCNETNNSQNNLRLWPIVSGSTWITKINKFDKDGSMLSEYYDTLKSLDIVEINEIEFLSTDEGWYIIQDSEGLKIYYDFENEQYWFFKYPSEPGEKFNLNMSIYNQGKDTSYQWLELVNKDSSIFIPGLGEFECLHYKYFDTFPNMPEGYNTFIAPGIGYVRREYFTRSPEGISYLSELYLLSEYDIPGVQLY